MPLRLVIARTEEEYLDAGRVLYSSYLVSGLVDRQEEEWVLYPFQLLSTSYVITAYYRTVGTTGLAGGEKRKTSVRKQFSVKPEAATSLRARASKEVAVVHEDIPVATATIVGDSDSGLPSESHFPELISSVRKLGKIAEVGCLASRSSYPLVISYVLGYVQDIGVHCYDAFVLCCHPSHVSFYRRKYGAKVLSPAIPVDRVHGSPGVLLLLANPTSGPRETVEEYLGIERNPGITEDMLRRKPDK